jgi:hypothetical protein
VSVPRLTPARLTVLRDARDGHVYRSERGYDLYVSYDRAQHGNKKVSAVVRRLCALGLLQIGWPAGASRPWHVTELGMAVLRRAAP